MLLGRDKSNQLKTEMNIPIHIHIHMKKQYFICIRGRKTEERNRARCESKRDARTYIHEVRQTRSFIAVT